MRVLAFDPGYRNLAFCDLEILQDETWLIWDWGVLDLCASSVSSSSATKKRKVTATTVFDALQTKFPLCSFEKYDCVTVEKQMARKMVEIACHIEMYCLCGASFKTLENAKTKVQRISASMKLHKGREWRERMWRDLFSNEVMFQLKLNQSSAYRRNKAESVQTVTDILQNDMCAQWQLEWFEFYKSHKKKDDLADTFLQALASN